MAEAVLIDAALNGDSHSFQTLYLRYRPVVYKLQGQYKLKDMASEDWQQEGQYVFFKTISMYEASHGVTLGAFFRVNFRRHVYSLVRAQAAQKRQAQFGAVSLEAILETEGEDSVYHAQTFRRDYHLEILILREQLQSFCQELSPFEVQVFFTFLRGELSKNEQGFTQTQLQNALNRVKNKLKRKIH